MNRRTRGTINYICHLNKTCCTDKNIKKISTNVGGEKNREERGREKKKNRETEREKQRERERLREREKKEKKYFWVSLAMFVYHDDGVLLVIECHDYTTMASHGMMDLP